MDRYLRARIASAKRFRRAVLPRLVPMLLLSDSAGSRWGSPGGISAPRHNAHSPVLRGGFARTRFSAAPLSLCRAACVLLLQGADVGDDVLNLGVGQLAGVALHLAHALFGLFEEVGVGRLHVFRRFQRAQLHVFADGSVACAVGAVTHGAFRFVGGFAGLLGKDREGQRNAQETQYRNSKILFHIGPLLRWPGANPATVRLLRLRIRNGIRV